MIIDFGIVKGKINKKFHKKREIYRIGFKGKIIKLKFFQEEFYLIMNSKLFKGAFDHVASGNDFSGPLFDLSIIVMCCGSLLKLFFGCF